MSCRTCRRCASSRETRDRVAVAANYNIGFSFPPRRHRSCSADDLRWTYSNGDGERTQGSKIRCASVQASTNTHRNSSHWYVPQYASILRLCGLRTVLPMLTAQGLLAVGAHLGSGLVCDAQAEQTRVRADAGVHPALLDRKSTRLNSSHSGESRMPSSA